MKELFVPYSIALALKEIGFDEPCLAHFDKGELNNYPHCLDMGYQNHEEKTWNCVSAPLYDQVIQWFIDKHGIFILVDFGLGWEYWLLPNGAISPVNGNGHSFKSRYEATQAGIEKAIELIKQKQ